MNRLHIDEGTAKQPTSRSSVHSPSSLASLPSSQQPAPPQLTLGVPPQPRPLLRARSTDGATTSSNETIASDSRGTEFALADLPSPILAHPSQGLSGLSEALAQLVTENPRSSDGASALSWQSSRGGERQEPRAYANNDAAYPSAAMASLIAKASKGGYRLGKAAGAPTRQGSYDTSQGSPPTALTSVSSQTPSGAGDRLRMDKGTSAAPFADDEPSSAGIGRQGQASYMPTAAATLRRYSNEPGSSGAGSANASHSSSPQYSGKSTPMHKSFSGRSKPKVLETSHLYLQTHAPSGRRMINQYVIEDELGRGVHGKVRLARDTETGERVAVKIVEREGKKRLGGNSEMWAARVAGGKMRENARTNEDEGSPIIAADYVERTGSGQPLPSAATGTQHARFATPPRSPTSSIGRYSAAGRYGRWGEGGPSRPTYGDLEQEKQREKARKRLLWTTDQKVKREIAIMKKCAHENVVRLKEVIDDPQSKKVFMVLEYMEGGEVRWKDDRGFPTLTVDQARRTLRDVVLGLEYLHYQGIIHRDIKPANLLWDKEQRVKISDFGVSHFSYALLVSSGGLPSLDSDEERQKDPSLADDRELAKTAGSPAFFAPELCLAGEPAYSGLSGTSCAIATPYRRKANEFPWSEGSAAGGSPRQTPTGGATPVKRARPPITKAIDVWALGVTLYCLLFGHVPFTADSEFALFSVITREDYALPTFMGADRIRIGPRKKRWVHQQPWTDEEGDVDEESTQVDEPDVDPSTLDEEALMVRDLLDCLLEKDPTKRIKLEDVKKHPWLTRGIADPPLWLSETDPAQLPFVQVTHEEVETALTGFSKFKQTLKRFQHKLLASLGGVAQGHLHEREHQRALASTAPSLGPPVKRRRSKSASHVSRATPSIQTNSTRTSPNDTMEDRTDSSIKVNSGITSHPPVAPSGRPHLFFSRRRSTAMDGGKQVLGQSRIGRSAHLHGSSVSQPNSRPHSPLGTGSSLLAATEEPSSSVRPSHPFRRIASPDEDGSREMSGLSPIVSGEAVRPPTEGLSLSSIVNPPRSKASISRLRPASRGSLRTLEGLGSTQEPAGSHTPTYPGSATISPSSSMRDHAYSGSTGPSRPRSRSRLSDVFRSVWSSHHNDSRPSRFRSRPGTAVDSTAVSPSLDKSAALQQRTPSAPTAVSAPVTARPLSLKSGRKSPGVPFSHAGQDADQQQVPRSAEAVRRSPVRNGARAVEVDDYDLDLDLSDDDSDVEQRRLSMQQQQQVMRGTSAGWALESMARQQSGSGGESRISEGQSGSSHSLTPSVEGGYNVFKPPFHGRFDLAQPADVAIVDNDQRSFVMDLGDSHEAAALRRASEVDAGAHGTVNEGEGGRADVEGRGAPELTGMRADMASASSAHAARVSQVQQQAGDHLPTVGDVSSSSDDRFADADEEGNDLRPISGSHVLEVPQVQRGDSNMGSDYSEGASTMGFEDDEDGVSFQAGRRSAR